MEMRPVALRGSRLALTRRSYRDIDDPDQAVTVDMLGVMEVDPDGPMSRTVTFDLDDGTAAFAELDARYLAGEAAPYSAVWSAVAGSYAALNRREPPLTTPGCANVDHRREIAFGPGDGTAYVQTGWHLDQGIDIYVEQPHRLSSIGAVVTYVVQATSDDGLDAEWRGIAVFTADGETINRTEVFDEADLDAALARFRGAQLSRPT